MLFSLSPYTWLSRKLYSVFLYSVFCLFLNMVDSI